MTPGKGDTEGFTLQEDLAIVNDVRGFKRFDLPRNNRRTIQSSLFLLQGWQANCDIQLILYDAHPDFPDPEEIAKVTDYIVAYACKGNESLTKEKAKIKEYVLGLKSNILQGENDSKLLARKILNMNLAERLLPKQECMIHLVGLPLFLCSECVDRVSISGSYKLGSRKYVSKANCYLKRYAGRTYSHDLGFDVFYYSIRNGDLKEGAKVIIPHYLGGKSVPLYPPADKYARSVIFLYKPWHGIFQETGRSFLLDFKKCIISEECPLKVKIAYNRVRQCTITKTQHVEPTSQVEIVNCSEFSLEISDDTCEAVALASTLQAGEDNDQDELDKFSYNVGLEYD